MTRIPSETQEVLETPKVSTSCSAFKVKLSIYLLGGTAMVTLGAWSSRVIATEKDEAQGRWSWIRFQCKVGKHIL